MVTYKITTAFVPEWNNVFDSLFPGRQHDASAIYNSVAFYSFNDDTVTPADLGPLVKVERVDSIPFHSP